MRDLFHVPSGTRKTWPILVLMVIVTLLFSGCGVTPPKVYRVGILSGLDVFATTVDGFKAKMTDLGYIEGQNITYDVQKTNSDREAEKRIIGQFVTDKVDLILVFPSEAAVTAKAVTAGTNIPVVFCQTNIEGTDLIKSVSEPGGNMTGVRYPGPDLAIKRFEILHELAPKAKRFWVPYSSSTPIVPPQLEMLRPVAAKAGITLVETPAATGADLEADLETRSKAADIGIDAILFISEPLARTPAIFPKVAKFAVDHNIPFGGAHASMEGYTSVFGVATDNAAVGALSAQQADKVLKGIPPGTIPVLSAESYFRLNYNVAQQFGLTVPEGLLKSANEVVR